LTAILELPLSWNDSAVARNPGVSWAFLYELGMAENPTFAVGIVILPVMVQEI